VLALAQDEAIRFNHNYIGTEHLLLGLVREGEGVAARVLDSFDVELSKVRTAVEFIIGRGDSTTSPSEITLSPRTKKVIELAIDEARKLGHDRVGTEHLLLGLIREGEGIASGVLESLGISLERLRYQVIATLGGAGVRTTGPAAGPDTARTAGGGGPFDRFTSESKRVLAMAQNEASQLNHNWIGTEHIALGLLHDQGPAGDTLRSLGVTLDVARAEVAKAVPLGTAKSNEMTLSPRTKAIVDRAVVRSRDAGNAMITPVLLLLALIDDAAGIGARVLATLGATPERIRAALDRPEPPAPGPSA
jgi:ATP-dependent Clp protease ATP-binding subunit ClpA